MGVKELEQWTKAWVLDNTPAVLSLGRRCMKEGYSFVWLRGEVPYFIRPDGLIVHLEVHGDIPYLVAGSAVCQPRKATMDELHPWLGAKDECPGVPAKPGGASEKDWDRSEACGDQSRRDEGRPALTGEEQLQICPPQTQRKRRCYGETQNSHRTY